MVEITLREGRAVFQNGKSTVYVDQKIFNNAERFTKQCIKELRTISENALWPGEWPLESEVHNINGPGDEGVDNV